MNKVLGAWCLVLGADGATSMYAIDAARARARMMISRVRLEM